MSHIRSGTVREHWPSWDCSSSPSRPCPSPPLHRNRCREPGRRFSSGVLWSTSRPASQLKRRRSCWVGTDIETETGTYGGFAFTDAPLGTVSVRVTAPGHPSVVQEVDVRSDRIVFLQVIVPSFAALLSELLVSVRGNESMAQLEGAQLTAADLLAIKVPSTRVTTGDIGKDDYQIRLRGYGSFTQTFSHSSSSMASASRGLRRRSTS